MIKMDMAVKSADKKGCPMKIQHGRFPLVFMNRLFHKLRIVKDQEAGSRMKGQPFLCARKLLEPISHLQSA
jgi:hypothetical protein